MKATAPGKIVLWGEYAVLTGAPAAVLAVNRYAEVDLQTQPSGWQFRCQGFKTAAVDTPLATFCDVPAAHIVELILAAQNYRTYPLPFVINSNSTAFYDPASGAKLGIGSSAAICTASYCLFAELLGWQPTMQQAVTLHRTLQGGKGSGLDVAASWSGGTIRFSSEADQVDARPFQWPAELCWCVVWTGSSSSTVNHLQGFNNWYEQNNRQPVERLAELSEALFNQTNLHTLAEYQVQLRRLDDAAGLNIFTREHQQLATIADRSGLVYKPCGAGGGDIGMAFATNPQALATFQTEVSAQGFILLDVEIAQHGVNIRT